VVVLFAVVPPVETGFELCHRVDDASQDDIFAGGSVYSSAE
jgi:hypothetical protein